MYQLCRRPGGRFRYSTVKDTDKKAWYDQNIEFWLYRYYMYRLYAIYRVSPCTRTVLKIKIDFF